jgi:signal transduction histidine kinase
LLYPHQIEVGVVAAVRALLADVPAAVGTRLTVDPAVLALDEPGDCRTTRGERLLVARVVEEAIGNALRHGHASGIAVSVGLDGDRLAIAVADDGCGLAGQPHDGSGLARLSERLRLAGGSLHVAPGPTGGVVVSAQVPIAALARHGAPV